MKQKMLELKDFVIQATTEICSAVREAAKCNSEVAITKVGKINYNDKEYPPFSHIEFDVAVTNTIEKSKEGKLATRITVASFLGASAEAKGTQKNESSLATRIKFSIPIRY